MYTTLQKMALTVAFCFLTESHLRLKAAEMATAETVQSSRRASTGMTVRGTEGGGPVYTQCTLLRAGVERQETRPGFYESTFALQKHQMYVSTLCDGMIRSDRVTSRDITVVCGCWRTRMSLSAMQRSVQNLTREED